MIELKFGKFYHIGLIMVNLSSQAVRYDWQIKEIIGLFELSLNDLLFKAHFTHRDYFNPNHVQLSTLLKCDSLVSNR